MTFPNAQEIDIALRASGGIPALSGLNLREVVELLYYGLHEYPPLPGEADITDTRYAYGDVRRYGAVGDGNALDMTRDDLGVHGPIQSAIESARPIADGGAGFGVVLVPRIGDGFYRQDFNWFLKSGVHVVGVGKPMLRNIRPLTDILGLQYVWNVGSYVTNDIQKMIDDSDPVNNIAAGESEVTVSGTAPLKNNYFVGQDVVVGTQQLATPETQGEWDMTYMRFNTVTEIVGRTLKLLHPNDEDVISALVLPASGTYTAGGQRRLLANAGIHGVRAHSEYFLGDGGGTYNCRFTDIDSSAIALAHFGNAYQRTTFRGLRGVYHGVVGELSMNSYLTTVDDVKASWTRNAGLTGGNYSNPGIIGISGQAKKLTLSDWKVSCGDMPNTGGGLVNFYNANHVTVEDWQVDLGSGHNNTTALTAGVPPDTFANPNLVGSRGNKHNRVRGMTVRSRGPLLRYMRYGQVGTGGFDEHKNGKDFVVEDCAFFGPVSAGAAAVVSPGLTLQDVLFESGDFEIDPYADGATALNDVTLLGGVVRKVGLPGRTNSALDAHVGIGIREKNYQNLLAARHYNTDPAITASGHNTAAAALTVYARTFAADTLKVGDIFELDFDGVFGAASPGPKHLRLRIGPSGLASSVNTIFDYVQTSNAGGRWSGKARVQLAASAARPYGRARFRNIDEANEANFQNNPAGASLNLSAAVEIRLDAWAEAAAPSGMVAVNAISVRPVRMGLNA